MKEFYLYDTKVTTACGQTFNRELSIICGDYSNQSDFTHNNTWQLWVAMEKTSGRHQVLIMAEALFIPTCSFMRMTDRLMGAGLAVPIVKTILSQPAVTGAAMLI